MCQCFSELRLVSIWDYYMLEEEGPTTHELTNLCHCDKTVKNDAVTVIEAVLGEQTGYNSTLKMVQSCLPDRQLFKHLTHVEFQKDVCCQ